MSEMILSGQLKSGQQLTINADSEELKFDIAG
jgi:hypothetical protein